MVIELSELNIVALFSNRYNGRKQVIKNSNFSSC